MTKKTNSTLINPLIILLVVTTVFVAIVSFYSCETTAKAFSLTSAESAVLMESTSSRVLFEQNANKKLPMASTTKIMTAYAICKTCNLDEIVEIPKTAVGIEGSSIYLREGEHLSVRELLYGLMLRSGNDCAVALAIHASGSVEAFAELMNKIAQSIGAKNSNFMNPHGLHHNQHYTTAFDLALITSHALQNKDFAEIVSTKQINISNEGYDYQRVLYNKNKLLGSYEFADGVKTGYTKKAGRCFVGSATKDQMQLVAVVLNCGPMFENSQSMLEFGFSSYTMANIVPQGKICGIQFDKNQRYYFSCDEQFSYPVKNVGGEVDKLSKKITLPQNMTDDGKIVVEFDGKVVFEHNLTRKAF